MKWQFIDTTTLQEVESGLKIFLLDGTWYHPGRLKSETPDHIGHLEQLQLIKSGLRYINAMGDYSLPKNVEQIV